MNFKIAFSAAFFALSSAPIANADAATINGVSASKSGDTWNFSVTVSHPDTGWDHYADGWAIESASGEQLGFRELLHPHVTEQPFTRSLGGLNIPDDSKTVFVRSRCIVDGWHDETFEASLEN